MAESEFEINIRIRGKVHDSVRAEDLESVAQQAQRAAQELCLAERFKVLSSSSHKRVWKEG